MKSSSEVNVKGLIKMKKNNKAQYTPVSPLAARLEFSATEFGLCKSGCSEGQWSSGSITIAK